MTTEARMTAWAEKVYAEATARYNEGGWDVIVECYTEADLVDEFFRARDLGEVFERPAATNYREARKRVKTAVDVWADRQADAINSAF